MNRARTLCIAVAVVLLVAAASSASAADRRSLEERPRTFFAALEVLLDGLVATVEKQLVGEEPAGASTNDAGSSGDAHAGMDPDGRT